MDSPTYSIWCGMKNRCSNRTNKDFAHYGGRDIKVCERWTQFENFLADMGERPPGLTIDRFPNNDGDYEPGNCRWATRSMQRRNTSNLLFATVGEKKMPLVEASELLGLKHRNVRQRVQRGWTPEQALGIASAPPIATRRGSHCQFGHARSTGADGKWRCHECRKKYFRDYQQRKRATARG